jgi:hypothetical protein
MFWVAGSAADCAVLPFNLTHLLAAIRLTQTWRGPMTSTVAQNSKHDPDGHIDSASTSILPPSWQTMT